MPDFVVDEWGNCWDRDESKRETPVLAHPELEPGDAHCPNCGRYVFRVEGHEGFEWHCACGYKRKSRWH